MCHWQLETQEGQFSFSGNPEHTGQPRCLTPQIACWHVLACVIAFSYRTFLQLVTLRKFSLVPLQGQKIENCNSFHGITRWTQMDVAWRATHVCSECILTKFDQSSWQNLSIFELILIHNHWGKSSEARSREIFRAPLTAGKIIRNQDEQGQLSWGLGSCCLNFCNLLHIHLLASRPRRYPCVSPC